MLRRTISNEISCNGIGGLTGEKIDMKLKPAVCNSGIVFNRIDLDQKVEVFYKNILHTKLNTTIAKNGVSISVVEHLISAFWCFGITDLEIELNGPEVPFMDGSSKFFCFLINCAGTKDFELEKERFMITKNLQVDGKHDSYIKIEPNDHLIIDYTINFPEKSIGRNNFIFDSKKMNYQEEISIAKTFCTEKEINDRLDFAKGWNEHNANRYGDENVFGDLRYTNEATRHKILDIIGDLMLSGYYINGKFTCYKSGHFLNIEAIEKIFSNKENYIIL